MRLSYSQIEWFLRCPYVYKCIFIDKEPVSKGKDAAFGGILHEVMQNMYAQTPFIPTLTQSMQFYEKQWDKRSLPSFFANAMEEQVYFKEGLNIIQDYYRQHGGEEVSIMSVERFFEVPIKDSKRGKIHLLTGRIDRIDKKANRLEIIDYKTGKTLRTNAQVSQDLQLSLYHLGVGALWPDLIERYRGNIFVSLYFLRHGEKISVKKQEEELEKTKKELIDYIGRIEDAIAKNSFEPKASFLCAREPYSRLCPFFKDRYRVNKPPLPNKQEVGDGVKAYIRLKEQEKALKKQITELSAMIHFYLDEEKLESIFDENIGITRSQSPLYTIDVPAIKAILESLGRWDEVLEISKTKLTKLKKELPKEYRKKIDEAQIKKGTTKSLRIKNIQSPSLS